MVTWYRHYAYIIAVHILEVAIIGSAVAIVVLARPSYSVMDVFVIVAVGMIAGAIYVVSMGRFQKHEQKQLEKNSQAR